MKTYTLACSCRDDNRPMVAAFIVWLMLILPGLALASVNISQVPLLVTQSVPPLVMLNVSSDSQLFFQAYPEYADLTGDGAPNTTYTHSFDYYGYFDSYKCYTHSSGVFTPASTTADKYCSSSQWSGNFLNWLTMARIDVVRKMLYGGYRSTDTGETILERTYLPNDAHSWVRFYDGDDLNQLSPFSAGSETTTTSLTSRSIVTGSRQDNDDRFTLDTPGWSSSEVQLGDQLEMTHLDHPGLWMRGVVVGVELSRSPPRITIQVTGSENPDAVTQALSNWQVVNRSRRGVSFCNTTIATGGSHESNALNAPPMLMVAKGDYSLWTANERWQCRWREDVNPNVPDRMRLHDQPFMNGNDVVSSGLWSNADSPRRNHVRVGEFEVRVRACVAGLVGQENCKSYPGGGIKPVGLLQEYGEDGQILFGLMTGSYTNHVSGGVLRKNVGSFEDEVNPETGQFILPADSMIRSLNALRIFGYSHNSGEYTAGAENCVFGTSKAQMIGGRCFSWGNPQAEIYAESLRYLAGLEPNSSFTHTGTDRIPNLTAAAWNNPITEALWCTNKSIIQFNASVTSFDSGAPSAASDLPGLGALATWTNTVGSGEGLAGASVFAGGSTGFCTAETIGNLAGVQGICPEAPNQDGTYHIAGLAHYAYTNDLRPSWEGEQTVKTYGVSLAPAVPRIEIPLPGETSPAVVILPACDNRGDNLRCALADFRIVEQDIAAGTGKFFIQWDVSEWGADFDMDINGTLSYVIDSDQILVTTQTWADSSGRETGFGYIISGTDNDGFHAHSGINNYRRTNAGSVPNCDGCKVGEAPTTATFSLGDSTAQLLREPLFYAAKWGGYHKTGSAEFPGDTASWDRTGDGLPDNYFFAIDPAKLAQGLTQAFGAIAQAAGATTAAAVSASVLDANALVYAAGFDSSDWSGELNAYRTEADGSRGPIYWNAAQRLATNTSRNIFTTARYDLTTTATSGVTLAYANLSAIQQQALDHNLYESEDTLGNERISWLRGSDTAHSSFRQRNGKILGDIVHSNPRFIPTRYQGISRLLGAPAYREIKDVIYVGANDGMLHAFDADTGDELFAFMPGELLLPESGVAFARVSRLMDEDYVENHRFFVDGTAVIAEASIDGEWKRILIGTMGAGGRSIFALDVSDPENFDANHVLWEFSHADLGYGVTKPVIARMNNGRWVVILGNGYNSAKHQAVLLIVDISDGSLLKSISTGVGSSSLPNGLAPAFWTDWPELEVKAQWVYAGDLLGHVWRFDVTHSNDNQWKAEKIFVAVNADGDTQPITSPLLVSAINEHDALMIAFGTGSYFRVIDGQDMPDAPIQSLYGLLDQPHTSTGNAYVISRADDLVQQEIIVQRQEQIGGETHTIRILSDHPVDLSTDKGWYIDLDRDDGERVINGPTRRAERVRFSTLIPNPDADPCSPSASGFFMDFNLRTGGRTDDPVFDLDGDGTFDDEDMVALDPSDPDSPRVPPSGLDIDSTGEPISTARDGHNEALFCDANAVERLIRGGGDATGVTGRGSAAACRQSWQQLR